MVFKLGQQPSDVEESKMAYSRWGGSKWYTYYDANSGPTKDSQIFVICCVHDFTYKELRQGTRKAINSLCNKEGFLTKEQPTSEELNELRLYMLQFIINVNCNAKRDRYDS